MSVLDRLQMMLLQMKQFTVEGNSCSNLISADDNRTKGKNKHTGICARKFYSNCNCCVTSSLSRENCSRNAVMGSDFGWGWGRAGVVLGGCVSAVLRADRISR